MEKEFELAGATETIGREHFYPSVRAAAEGCVNDQASDRSHTMEH